MTVEPSGLAMTFDPPYWAVIFSSVRTDGEGEAYDRAAKEMVALAATMPGDLGIESARDPATGIGITVSDWQSEAAIAAWGAHADHLAVQRLGRDRWYEAFRLRVARVERDRTWQRSAADAAPAEVGRRGNGRARGA